MLTALRILVGQPAVAVRPALSAGLWERIQSNTYASSSGSSSSEFGSSSSSSPGGLPSAGTSQGDDQQQPEADVHQQLPVQQALVDQLLSPENMNRRQRFSQRKGSIMQEYQRAPGDTGSPEVQIALLTERIRDMTEHIMAHKKDHVSKRGLQGYLNQRRKLLSYLRRDNFPRYAYVIHKLGLKDTYAQQERYDKYRVGTRLGTPAEPLKRYGSH